MDPLTVPTVDLTAYVDGGTASERRAVAEAVDAACRRVGFMEVVGHAVPPEMAEGLASALDGFFGLPTATKRRWIRPASENRGYTPPRTEALALSAGMQSQTRMKDFFEAFNVGSSASDHPGVPTSPGGHPEHHAQHYAENPWPDADVRGFRAAVDAWRGEAGRVARILIGVFEDALGLKTGQLAALATHPIEVLRMNNYALDDGIRIELDEDTVGMGEHTDYGLVTVLWADPVPGLQVLHDSAWRDVTPSPGALLVNLGDLTTRLTNEQWLSTLHRVKPPVVAGTVRRRRSAAYFFDGDPEAVVGPFSGFVDAAHPPLYRPVTIDEHVRAKLAGSRAGVLNPGASREASRLKSSV